MTRRAWIPILGAALCSGLLSACTHPAAARRPDDAATMAEAPPVGPPAPSASPYHQTAVVAPPDAAAQDTQVHQATYPTPHPPALSVELPAASAGPEARGAPAAPPAAEAPARHVDDPPLVAALRCFLEKHPAEAVRLLEGYDKTNQDLLLCLLPLAARLTEGNLAQASPQEVGHLVNQLDGALPSLRSRAELVLDRVCFCAWIRGFGRYEPLPEGHAFHVGEPVQVYVELQNVSSQPCGEAYATQLASSLVLRDADQHVVWRHDFGDRGYRDLSQSPRHDYFNNCRFCVPDVPPGPYTLSIEVEDVPTRRIARRALDFRVTTVPARDS